MKLDQNQLLELCSKVNVFPLWFQPIGYDCFVLFMETYLDAELPEELCKHLFYSFMKKPSQVVPAPQNVGKDLHLKDVAAVTASQTVCAPITHLGTEILVEKDRHHSGLAEKLHGLTEKLSLHGLGHSRHDSGSGELGRRSRAGTQSLSIILGLAWRPLVLWVAQFVVLMWCLITVVLDSVVFYFSLLLLVYKTVVNSDTLCLSSLSLVSWWGL